MKPRIDLRDLCPDLLSCNARSIRPSARRGLATAGAVLLLSLAAGPLHAQQAQQDWPPDDAYNAAPQQYPQAQQNAYPQPPQQAYQRYAQPQYAQPAYPQSGYPQPAYPQPSYNGQAQQGYGQQLSQAQALSPDQLTQLVAPIALYPDALVAQILAASTYPAQVSAADQWLRSMGGAAPEQIAAGADAQSNWDPSIKALTAFPQVLAMLDQNLQWTTSLGNAYYNQPQDVMQTIQVMRDRAEQAGNLQNTPQEQVTDNGGAIDIAPANPQVVYVPAYNPWDVYGQPVSPYPGFSLIGAIGSFLGSGLVHFGPGIAMNAFMTTPWGLLGWGLDWLAHAVLFNHSSYFTHSNSVADWGFPHGGPRAYPGTPQLVHGGYGGVHNAYARSYGRPEFNDRASDYRASNYRAYGQGFSRPAQPYGDARSAEGFNRGFPQRAQTPAWSTPARTALPSTQMAYNRYPQSIARPQQFENRQPAYESRQPAYSARTDQYGRQSYGSAFSNPSRDSYAPRQGMGYAGQSPAYRAPENNYRGPNGRAYDSYRGGEIARSQSGGFFGGHESGGKAPKAFSYSRGGSGGWKAPKAPKESHSSGGHSGGHEHSSHHR
jgi:uncharacterized protein DUF3300